VSAVRSSGRAALSLVDRGVAFIMDHDDLCSETEASLVGGLDMRVLEGGVGPPQDWPVVMIKVGRLSTARE